MRALVLCSSSTRFPTALTPPATRTNNNRPGELEAKLKADPVSMSDLKINEILDSELRFVTQITGMTFACHCVFYKGDADNFYLFF